MRITRRQGLQGLAAGAASVAMPAIVSGQEKEIVIGAPASLTGGLGEVGARGAWGSQIAVDQINREGGIKSMGGAKLKLVPLPASYFAWLAVILLSYSLLTQLVKVWYRRRFGSWL